jgi:tetratricopeptide (TPR) repeat protein
MKIASSIVFLVFFGFVLKGQNVVFPPLPDSCFDVIVFAIPTAQLSPAKEKFAQELDSLLHTVHPDTFVLATLYRRLSTALFLSSGDTNAVEYALKSLQLFEQLQQPLEIAKSRLAYASSLFMVGHYDTAINLLQTAVEQNRALFGEVSSIQQLTYRVLCVAFHNVARHKESLFYINESVRIARAVYPLLDLRLAKSLWNRGASLYEIRQLEASLQDFLEAKEIVSALLGYNHPAVGEIYQRIGRVYKDMGDLENALAFYQQSLNLKEQFLGSDHGETLYTNSWMAELI